MILMLTLKFLLENVTDSLCDAMHKIMTTS